MATDEILMASRFAKDTDGCWLVHCPHCKRVLGLESGPIRGEQYLDRSCGGWLEVEQDAERISLEQFEKITAAMDGSDDDQ